MKNLKGTLAGLVLGLALAGGGVGAYAWLVNTTPVQKAETTQSQVTNGLKLIVKNDNTRGHDNERFLPGAIYDFKLTVQNTANYNQEVNIENLQVKVLKWVNGAWTTEGVDQSMVVIMNTPNLHHIIEANQSSDNLNVRVGVRTDLGIQNLTDGTYRVEVSAKATGSQTDYTDRVITGR